MNIWKMLREYETCSVQFFLFPYVVEGNIDAGSGLNVGVEFCFTWSQFLLCNLKRISYLILGFHGGCVRKSWKLKFAYFM
jgi:hypothetical protein